MAEKMRYNKIIDLLEQGKPVFSTSTVPNGSLDDLTYIADADYDAVIIEMEHEGFSFNTLRTSLLGNPFAVQQNLQGGTQGVEAKTLVFHFNDDRVVVGISNVGQVIQTAVRDRAGAENRLAVLEEVDDLVVAYLLSHVFPLPVSGLAAGLSLYPSLSLL